MLVSSVHKPVDLVIRILVSFYLAFVGIQEEVDETFRNQEGQLLEQGNWLGVIIIRINDSYFKRHSEF